MLTFRLRLRARDQHRDVVVRAHSQAATLADLVEVARADGILGPLPALEHLGDHVAIDGRATPNARPLRTASLADGSEVDLLPHEHVTRPAPLVGLRVTAGYDVGREIWLPAGMHRVCRRSEAPVEDPALHHRVDDPTLGGQVIVVHVDGTGGVAVSAIGVGPCVEVDGVPLAHPADQPAGLTDTGIDTDTRGVGGRPVRPLPGWERPWDGERPPAPRTAAPGAQPCRQTIRCGLAELTLVATHPRPLPRPVLPAPPLGSATRPLHRTPAPAPPPEPTPIALPAERVRPPAVPLGLVGVVGGLGGAAVAVAVTGSWAFAALALAGPLSVAIGALDGRRRHRRDRRGRGRRNRAEQARVAAALDAQAAAWTTRRVEELPGLLDAIARVRDVRLPLGRAHRPGCWGRRLADDRVVAVRVGTGTVDWRPVLAGDQVPDRFAPLVATRTASAHQPVGVELRPGHATALVGPRWAAAALARSLVVQAVVRHGPADVRVGALAAPARRHEWSWSSWLPHARLHGDDLLAFHPAEAERVADTLVDLPTDGRTPAVLVIVDDPSALAGRRTPARRVLRAPAITPVVLVEADADVPASCATVLRVDDLGRLTGASGSLGPVAPVGTSVDTAAEVARTLAGFDDPESDDAAAAIPGRVELADVHDLAGDLAVALAGRWKADPDPAPVAVVGWALDGPFAVDLAVDGPHALVAGTTGSGKSELLRTLVAALALEQPPTHLTFVLVDFKGGSAFDVCASLPHVVGVLTDLDRDLVRRALRCLEAELRRREAVLRDAGAEDLHAFRRHARPGQEPLARLVVVVDEFAGLAAELPELLDALVGVAQRGRSLGVHLVLATQRPAGCVSDQIRANAGLRIALRVHGAEESRDVIDAPDAAALSRHHPGRALARIGTDELVLFQAALASAVLPASGPVSVAPLAGDDEQGGSAPPPPPTTSDERGTGPTSLEVVVTACQAAWRRLGGAPPRRPWPEPLPGAVGWSVADAPRPGSDVGHRLTLGLADEPDRQRQVPWTWDQDRGPLLAVGLPGSGPASVATTAVLEACSRWDPHQLHVHVLDLAAGHDLRPLAHLPHVGAVIGPGELERQRRALAMLARHLDDPPSGPKGAAVRRLVVVHGLAVLRGAWEATHTNGPWEDLLRLTRQGAGLGLGLLLTSDGPAVPPAVLAACAQRVVFGLADRADLAGFGVPTAEAPADHPGRGVALPLRCAVQVAAPLGPLADAVALVAARRPAQPAGPTPDVVATLPTAVELGDLGAPSPHRHGDGTVALLIGTAEADLGPATVVLRPGGHALVAGPPGSGRTTALRTLAASARSLGHRVVVVLGSRTAPSTEDGRSWDADAVVPVDHPDLAGVVGRGPGVVLIDDADATPPDHPLLSWLATDGPPDLHLVAAARADRARAAYGHWLRDVRAHRSGILLDPDPDLDGDLLEATLPRRFPVAMGPGRAWCVAPGRAGGVVQVATPGPAVVDPDR